MGVQPNFEEQASEEVKLTYKGIKDALGSPSLPVFFAYIGAFPEYLTYIRDPLVENLKDPKFKTITERIRNEMIPLINQNLKKTESLKEWIDRYQHSPAFYQFQKDIDNIFLLNLKLAFIFVALREAVKGWAVAAKKLKEKNFSKESAEDFIFDEVAMEKYPHHQSYQNTNDSKSLIKSQPFSIEKDLMGDYFNLCRIDFANHIKTNIFWAVRIGLEETILNTLPLFPHLIRSPINAVFALTSKYPDFPDLVYLLSEHFPTSSVQRVMFSGYMKI